MPELAEVEVVRQVLDNNLKDRVVIDVACFYEPIVEQEINFFKESVINNKIMGVERLAKYLIFKLEKGYMVSHLRMEGKYFYLPVGSQINKHVHLVFYLDNGYMLLYSDVRKFGRIFYSDENVYLTSPLSDLGYEANCEEYDVDIIYNKLQKKRLPIKTVLLDQHIISGLGNIYVDEVLYACKINPNRLSFSITKAEIRDIMTSSRKILNLAIENKGTTIRSYTSSLGVNGNYQNFLKVHTKNVCPNCNQKLNKNKIGGRTSYYCSNCQR